MTQPHEDLGGLEVPSAYTATGAIYHSCTGCGAEPGQVCTFQSQQLEAGRGVVLVTKPRNFPCLKRFVETTT